jgi:hypothetical protein
VLSYKSRQEVTQWGENIFHMYTRQGNINKRKNGFLLQPQPRSRRKTKHTLKSIAFVIWGILLSGIFLKNFSEDSKAPGEFYFPQKSEVKLLLPDISLGSSPDSILIKRARWAAGPCYTVAVSKDLICINNGGYLDIYSNKEISNPVLMSRSLIDFVPSDMILNQNHLYLRNASNKFILINLENPEDPKTVSYLDLGPEPIFDWKLFQEKLYIAEGNGITILDVSNPEHIKTIISDFRLFDNFIYSIDIFKNTIISVIDKEIYFIDITNDKKPKIATNLSFQESLKNVVIQQNLLYLINNKEIQVFDFDNKVSPELISKIGVIFSNHEIVTHIHSDHLFINSLGNDLVIIDISNPIQPLEVARIKGSIFDVSFNDSLIYLANHNELKIIESLDFKNFEDRSWISTKNPINIAGIKDNHLYLNDKKSIFSILDISSIDFPISLKNNFSKLRKGKLNFYKNFAYQISQDTLNIYDFKNLSNPELLTSYELGYSVWDADIFSNFLILSSYRNGLTIYDISDPTLPQELTHFSSVNLGKIVVNGSYLYGENISTFFVINLQDPKNLAVEGVYYPNGIINDFCIQNKRAYLCIDDSGLLTLELSNPRLPVFENIIPGRFKSCTIQDNYLITMPDVKVYNISNPSYPKLNKNYLIDDSFDSSGELYVYKNYLFVTEDNLGLFVFENQKSKKQVSVTSFSEGFPNPFNSIITIRYQLDLDAQVIIDIFDIQGHHVKNLLNEHQVAGEYDISWDATNAVLQPVASGLYLYRIIANELTDTQKILLIR